MLVKLFQAVVCTVCRVVTLARFGIGSLMMVQMDRNMYEQ